MKIIRPGSSQTVHVSEITKTKMAAIINEQSAQIRGLREQVQLVGRALIAIALEPEAFSYDVGRPMIAASAIAKVEKGMTLEFTHLSSGNIALSVIPPEPEPLIQAPRFVGGD